MSLVFKNKVVLVRHGQTLWNLEKRTQGHLDSPLTETGVLQAKETANRLKDYKFDLIISSPLGRALQTAKIISEELKISKIQTNSNLSERQLGVLLGRDILNKKTTMELRRLGMILGREYWKMGYRGYFDIDAVIAKDTKEIYLIETNTRRTGGTHVYDIAKKLFGTKWEQKNFLISNDQFCYGKKVMAPKIIFEKNFSFFKKEGNKYPLYVTFFSLFLSLSMCHPHRIPNN